MFRAIRRAGEGLRRPALLAAACVGLAACNTTPPVGPIVTALRSDDGGSTRSIQADGARENTGLDPKYVRQRVRYVTSQPPGTIVVDPDAKFLYLVQEGGYALRYGVGVGREGFGWSGTATIQRKAEWPTWTPPAEMIKRQPELKRYAKGMPGGPDNPLGARALYLYQNGKDTLYRLHGTNEPATIGTNVSSGCVRLLNKDIRDLFSRVPNGAKVVVLPNGDGAQSALQED